MWGDQLWDVRAPRAVHRFDSFTGFATGFFHPAGAPHFPVDSLHPAFALRFPLSSVLTKLVCKRQHTAGWAAPLAHVDRPRLHACEV